MLLSSHIPCEALPIQLKRSSFLYCVLFVCILYFEAALMRIPLETAMLAITAHASTCGSELLQLFSIFVMAHIFFGRCKGKQSRSMIQQQKPFISKMRHHHHHSPPTTVPKRNKRESLIKHFSSVQQRVREKQKCLSKWDTAPPDANTFESHIKRSADSIE